MAAKQRLDLLLVERELVESRAKAQALVMAGKVQVKGQKRTKPGERFAADVEITVAADAGWASRGAHKLLGAIASFPALRERIEGAHCIDIGASTGGFTDVLLRHGAAGVIAVDVGYGQLVWRLQSDERVVVMDRTNIRYLDPTQLPWTPSVATCDASFISVTRFVDLVYDLLAPGAVFVVLVKPQFEVGRERVGKGGVVRDEGARQDALAKVRSAAEKAGFHAWGAEDSALAGPKGNREILLVLEKPPIG